MSEIPLRANFNYPTSYRLGAGRLSELPTACSELGIERPLVVTDPGVREQGWFNKACAALATAGFGYEIFGEVPPNPLSDDVQKGVAKYLQTERDGCLLIGGGAALDVGKCIALMANHPGTVFDYEDVGDNWKRVDERKIPAILAVPTTAGTGSEVGRAAVITDDVTHAKRIIFHPRLMPRIVIADPEVTLTLPPHLTAATGMDAFAHCFEAYCATGYHPMADGIALEGMRLIRNNLPQCYRHGNDTQARTHMMMASAMGATAFQKGLGLVHALSHPLGGATGMHHGLSNAVFLPYVMEFNRDVIQAPMDLLARHLGLEGGYSGVLRWLLDLRRSLGIPHTLAEVDGIDPELMVSLAPAALQDPSLSSNPRPASVTELERVYQNAWHGVLG